MGAAIPPGDNASVACDVCLKEIPRSEAGTVEAENHVLYFCGLDCYRQWRRAGIAAAETED